MIQKLVIVAAKTVNERYFKTLQDVEKYGLLTVAGKEQSLLQNSLLNHLFYIPDKIL